MKAEKLFTKVGKTNIVIKKFQMLNMSKTLNLPEREKIQRISAVIRYAGDKLVRKFPILKRQNLLGALILLTSCFCFLLNSYLCIQGIMPAWLCFILNAFCTSFLHELEHDLIHNLYFGTRPFIQNTFMTIIWIFRGNLISPWYRKMIHMLHHREAGQTIDIEERLIGNGMKYGLKRLITMFDTALGWINFNELKQQIPQFSLKQIWGATFPIFIIFNVIWFSFLTHQGWKIINLIHTVVPPFPEWYIAIVNTLMIVYVGPNILRQGCLSFVSSNCHYYGDIKKADILKQTQVLQPWYLFPFQLFCFNFGGTHAIHHFVIDQPFYLRQFISPLAHAAMKKYGVRFNDIATFIRNNRYYDSASLVLS